MARIRFPDCCGKFDIILNVEGSKVIRTGQEQINISRCSKIGFTSFYAMSLTELFVQLYGGDLVFLPSVTQRYNWIAYSFLDKSSCCHGLGPVTLFGDLVYFQKVLMNPIGLPA